MAGIRVLLVDDEEDLVSTLEERLRLRGLDADGVVSGQDALKRIRQKEYDVVVLDIKMPGIGGLEVMKTLHREHPGVPVILFTGHGSAESGEANVPEGAFDYLVKPVDIEALVQKIKSAAASTEGQSTDE